MSDASGEDVPRTPQGPTKQDVLEEMRHSEPYKVADLHEIYNDVSRWTIQRRLDALREDGEVEKKKHADDSVTWFIRPDSN